MRWPDGFMWGTAASSTQCEGAAPASDWIDWERDGHAPASGDGNGFAARYAEDFRTYAGLGLRHHRLSIEWARIEPAEGEHDPEAVAPPARPLGRILPEDDHVSAVAGPEALQDLDRRGLAGPVRTEEREDLAVANLEVDPSNRFAPPVGLAQAPDLDGERPGCVESRRSIGLRVHVASFVSYGYEGATRAP